MHMRLFGQTLKDDRGASMVEYGLIVALVAVMALSAVTLLGEQTGASFTTLAAELEGSDNGSGGDGGSGSEDDDGGDQGDDNDQGNNGGNGGNGDDAGNNGDDDDNGDDAGNNGDDDDNGDDAGNNGDDDDNGDDAGNNGNDEDHDADAGGSGDEDDEDETSGPSSNPTETASSFYWWNQTKHGGYGAWTASVSYQNDTNRHQYLNLEITRVDDKGRESVGHYNNFYVPANGETTYTHWSNNLEDKNGKLSGTVEVKVKVLSIKTSDENWQSVSFDLDEDPVTVAAPPTS